MPRYFVTYHDPDTHAQCVAEIETGQSLAVFRTEAFIYGVLINGGKLAVAPWLVRGLSLVDPRPDPSEAWASVLPGIHAQTAQTAIETPRPKRGRGR